VVEGSSAALSVADMRQNLGQAAEKVERFNPQDFESIITRWSPLTRSQAAQHGRRKFKTGQ